MMMIEWKKMVELEYQAFNERDERLKKMLTFMKDYDTTMVKDEEDVLEDVLDMIMDVHLLEVCGRVGEYPLLQLVKQVEVWQEEYKED